MVWEGLAHGCVLDVLTNPKAALLTFRFASAPKDASKRDLRSHGYIGYCYIRHGLSGNLYLDNVEANGNMVTPEVASALAQWIREAADENEAPTVHVGKSYSNGILNGLGFEDSKISLHEVLDDMPEGSGTYADITGNPGTWALFREGRTAENGREPEP